MSVVYIYEDKVTFIKVVRAFIPFSKPWLKAKKQCSVVMEWKPDISPYIPNNNNVFFLYFVCSM